MKFGTIKSCCFRCPPPMFGHPYGCFSDAVDPSGVQFAITVTGMVEDGCGNCTAWNRTYTPLTWGGDVFDVCNYSADPVAIGNNCDFEDTPITVDLNLFCDGGFDPVRTTVQVKFNLETGAEIIEGDLILNGPLTLAALDGMVVPLDLIDSQIAGCSGSPVATIHVL